ncbi:MAG TPA: hypothetical protein VK661_04690 [Planctomycetota bacterium]|nr:hypothetical protein [Planctomycetota bacterium]
MSAILALLVLLAPQENDPKRSLEAALGMPGLAKPQEVKEAPPPASFTAGREKRTADDYKGLLDHNVFSPPRKKDPPKTADVVKPPEGPKSKTYVLTGIVFISAEKRYEALIEERAGPDLAIIKEAKFYKAGDTVAGGTVSEITFEQVSFLRGGSPTVLKVKDSVIVEGVASSETPAKVDEPGEVEKARERLKKKHQRQSVPDEAEDEAGERKKPK